MPEDTTPYLDTLSKVPGIRYKRFLYGEWLPERGLEDVPSEDIYKAMHRTGMTYQEIQQLTYDQFQQLKG